MVEKNLYEYVKPHWSNYNIQQKAQINTNGTIIIMKHVPGYVYIPTEALCVDDVISLIKPVLTNMTRVLGSKSTNYILLDRVSSHINNMSGVGVWGADGTINKFKELPEVKNIIYIRRTLLAIEMVIYEDKIPIKILEDMSRIPANKRIDDWRTKTPRNTINI